MFLYVVKKFTVIFYIETLEVEMFGLAASLLRLLLIFFIILLYVLMLKIKTNVVFKNGSIIVKKNIW